jgi:hypothetical protein
VILQVSAGVGFPDIADTLEQSASTTTVRQSAGTTTLERSASKARAPLSPIRVRPIPDVSPPTIDSRATVPRELSPCIQGTLAISFRGSSDAMADPRDPETSAPSGRQRTFSSALPEPETWVRHMAQALIEIMSGARPAPQVIRWTTPEIYSSIARRNVASGRRTLVTRPAIVRRVRICEPVDGVIEACAVVVDNGRVRALAMRLTAVDRRWVVSALQVG